MSTDKDEARKPCATPSNGQPVKGFLYENEGALSSGSESPPAKRTGIVSYHEGALHSRPDSPATVSFGYWRGNYPGNGPKRPPGEEQS